MSDENSNAGTDEYWYNTKTKQVEKGPQSSWEHRMGPYGTEEEARGALSQAAANSAEWDAEDKDWNS